MTDKDEQDYFFHMSERESLPVSQRDLAQKLNLSQSTVSLALSGNPRISKQVREQVINAAQELGYKIDPRLSALANYRNQKVTDVHRGNLGWVTNHPTANGWRFHAFVKYLEGARKIVEKMGYSLDEFWMADPKVSPTRFREILVSRGIKGLFLAPQQQPDTSIQHNLDDFSVVTFGHSLVSPQFHNVKAETFVEIKMLYHELSQRDHKRIGLVMERHVNDRLGHLISAGFLASEYSHHHGKRPPLILSIDDRNTAPPLIIDWLKKEKPDAIITTDPQIVDQLKTHGIDIPNDLSVSLHMTSEDGPYGGIVVDNTRIGELGAQRLISMIHNWESGIPKRLESTAVAGYFHLGETIRG